MLQTNLKHITTKKEFDDLLNNNGNVMLCCGRMGPMCIPVYQAMIEIEKEYPRIEFYDMAFDEPVSAVIRNLPECRGFMGLPFTVYFSNNKVVKATSGIQTKEQIVAILNKEFPAF
jgi:thioredoxin 1